jgi:hypothetical protein
MNRVSVPIFSGRCWRGGNRRRSNTPEGKGARPTSMSNQPGFISADQFYPDPYTQSRNADRTLNAAIVHADISRSYDEYLEIFDEFYADGLEASSETMEEPLRGKERVRSLLFNSWLPFMPWPRSAACRYPFEKRRFLGMRSTRPKLHGHWSWSGSRAKSAR